MLTKKLFAATMTGGDIREKNRKDILMEAANASHTPAPESTVTVAPFQAWRSSQFIVARGPAKATITIDANDNRHGQQTSIRQS